MDTKMDERVTKGLQWILTDGSRYGVDESRIDLDAIKMGSTVDCVLGQARGGYAEADSDGYRCPGYTAVLNALTEDGTLPDMSDDARAVWAYAHGFLSHYRDGDNNVIGSWDQSESLRTVWRIALKAHRHQLRQTVS